MAVHLRRKRLKDGRQSLYLDIYHAGQRKPEYLQFYLTGNRETDREILQKAKELQAQRQLEISLGRYGFSSEHSKDFWKFAEGLIASKQPGNRLIFNKALAHLKRFSPQLVRFEQLTPKFCSEFGAYLLAQPRLKVGTALLYYIKLRTICHAAVRQELLRQNPCEPIHYQSPEQPIRYLRFEEIQKLASTPCRYRQVRNGFLFCSFVGLRLGDVQRLHWPDISDGVLMITQGKTGRLIRIPLATSARYILSEQQKLNPDGPCFVYPSYRVVRRTLVEWSRAAGLERHLTHHMSRHSFAVMALNNGIELNVVSELLGHSKLAMTAHYAKLLDSTKQTAIMKLPSL